MTVVSVLLLACGFQKTWCPLISHVNNLIYKMWLRYLQPNTSSEEKVSNILQKKTLRLYSAVVETFISGKTFVRR